MPKAIFFNLPAHGHINPSLGLVTELVQRGHEIIYFATEAYRPKIEAAGADFRAYDADTDPSSANLGNFNALGVLLITAAEQVMPQALAAVEEEKPDYIIFDSLCVWGWQVAQKTGLPSVSSSGTFIFTPRVMLSVITPRQAAAMVMDMPGNLKYRRQYQQVAQRLREKHGINSPSLLETLNLHGDITLVYTSKAMQPAGDTLPASFKFVGPGLLPGASSGDFPLEQLMDKKVIYISLGTIFNADRRFYEACLQAFADSEYTVVVSLGQKFTPDSFGSIPPNFILRNHVPQLDVLQRASLFITHGGMNSVHEGLYFGVPLIVVPQMFEQEVVARQVVRNQAGVMLDKNRITADLVRQQADDVLAQPVYRQNALRVRDTLRNAGGASKAADEIQAFIRK